jgi:putative endonuclease
MPYSARRSRRSPFALALHRVLGDCVALWGSQNRFSWMMGYVYIVTNRKYGVLYTGFTTELKNRVEGHKTTKYKGSFSSKYNTHRLVYFESFERITEAREREKQIKGGSRMKKIQLIEALNPEWKDLYLTL